MELSICAIFRDNENYLSNFLIPILSKIEKTYNLHYYFYENDSKDNTKFLLDNFMKTRKGKLLCENNDTQNFNRDTSFQRINNISNCRNKLFDLKPFKGEWSIMIDSDITFPLNLIEQFFKINKPKNLVALGCNGKDLNKCRTHSDCNHFYDTLALIDKNNNLGLDFLCRYGFQCCPFQDKEDREKWFKGELVKVKSTYGGTCFYKTDILNKKNIFYEVPEVKKTICPEKEIVCEHWGLSEKLSNYGDIYVCPSIIVKNTEV